MGKHKLLKNQTEITYKKSAGIPFRWECKIKDEDIVKYVENYVLKDENVGALCGAPIYINYVFEGLKEGKTIITFQYYNFADNYIDYEEKYDAVVDSNLKLIINKK